MALPGVAVPQLCAREKELARQFQETYYRMFDQNRAGLGALYRDATTVCFEGDMVTGGNAFLTKLAGMNLPPNASHRVVTYDGQPCAGAPGVLAVFITGEYVGQQFSEVFLLVPEGSGGYYIHNQIFRVGNANAFNVVPAARDVAKGFVEFYFRTYDTARAQLAPIYRPTSLLTFENEVRQGTQAIMEQLTTLSPDVQHDPASITCDALQVNGNAMILIFITGRLSIDQALPLNFSQIFVLIQDGASYFVGNDIFKLKYG